VSYTFDKHDSTGVTGRKSPSIQVSTLFLHNHAFTGRKSCFRSGRSDYWPSLALGLNSSSWL
jgi:hypothetical protein